jgi:hypothetical protein
MLTSVSFWQFIETPGAVVNLLSGVPTVASGGQIPP